MEVLADPLAQRTGLAHIDHRAKPVTHQVHTRLVRELADLAANAIVDRHDVHASKDSAEAVQEFRTLGQAQSNGLPLAGDYVRFTPFTAISAATPVEFNIPQLDSNQLWERFKKYYTEFPSINLSLDISRMNFTEKFIEEMRPRLAKAFKAMDELEAGAIASPDENRMVGHYRLRNSDLAPTPEIKAAIDQTLTDIKAFTAKVHAGEINGADGKFEHFLVIGIGGSTLGPQFVAKALTQPGKDRMTPWFIDNTDPDGIDQIKEKLVNLLGKTLVIVISKSGGTKETRNGMLEIQAAYEEAGLSFSDHAVAVTGRTAISIRWLRPGVGFNASPCGTGSVAEPAKPLRLASCRPRSRDLKSMNFSEVPPHAMKSIEAIRLKKTRPHNSPPCGTTPVTVTEKRTW